MFEKAHPPPGSRPGTLALPAGSPPPRLRLVAYDEQGIEEREIDHVEDLAPYAHATRTTWIGVQGFGDEHVLRRIADLFDIQPLALEDAINVPHRPATESRGPHHVVIARAVQRNEHGRLLTPQVCLLIGARVLITFEERPLGLFEPVRTRLREGVGPIRRLGPDYLAYAILDTIVDRWFPVLDEIARELERAEEEAFESGAGETPAALHRLRHEVVHLRRVGWPQREAIAALLREPSPTVGDEVRGFLRDTHDHMVQIMEGVDACREMAAGLMELVLTSLSQRTNEVMKVLTLMASLFIPLTFLAGLYGMNFRHMPGLDHPWAYPIVLGVMATTAAGMLAWFRRKGWIGRGGAARRRRSKARTSDD